MHMKLKIYLELSALFGQWLSDVGTPLVAIPFQKIDSYKVMGQQFWRGHADDSLFSQYDWALRNPYVSNEINHTVKLFTQCSVSF